MAEREVVKYRLRLRNDGRMPDKRVAGYLRFGHTDKYRKMVKTGQKRPVVRGGRIPEVARSRGFTVCRNASCRTYTLYRGVESRELGRKSFSTGSSLHLGKGELPQVSKTDQ